LWRGADARDVSDGLLRLPGNEALIAAVLGRAFARAVDAPRVTTEPVAPAK